MDKVHSVQELIERTKDMPLEKMRFFIKEDRKEPRCFGIYQDTFSGHWVVYKNKDDGSRAVRYSGPDEAYAAQELWAKIQSEIGLRRAKQPARQPSRGEIIRRRVLAILLVAAIAVAGFMLVRWISRRPNRGYYLIDDDVYYYQSSNWYYYDDGDWLYYYDPVDYDWYNGHYYGSSYYGFDDYGDAFEYSDYYVEPSSDNRYSNDDDDDDDWDIFDSWDSSDTDWSSDW